MSPRTLREWEERLRPEVENVDLLGEVRTTREESLEIGRLIGELVRCNGSIQTYHLGHEFITDVLELRFEGPGAQIGDRDLWLSVLYALLEGASEALGIPRTDLNGTLYPYSGSVSPALVLFDDVPGGAALVRRVADNLPLVFRAAWRRVDRCECGEETSCYQCLRNYYNQYYHEQLRRGLARDFLAEVLALAGQALY